MKPPSCNWLSQSSICSTSRCGFACGSRFVAGVGFISSYLCTLVLLCAGTDVDLGPGICLCPDKNISGGQGFMLQAFSSGLLSSVPFIHAGPVGIIYGGALLSGVGYMA